MKEKPEIVEVGGREVRITSPSKVYFPEAGVTKRELIRYYTAVGEGALRGVYNRPFVLKRFVDGIAGEAFFQKRAPEDRPEWVNVVELKFPSGRTAREVVITELAQLLWVANLGCIDLNPHPVRADDLEHPDELRVDLDPGPDATWDQVRRATLCVRGVLAERGLVGWPKTSGSRGMHVLVRLERRWSFDEVRQSALAIAREVERRMPGEATSKWWKEERLGVFLDYNQNAKDRTVASAYSVRPVKGAWVSAPLAWDEVAGVELGDHTLFTMPARFAARGDLHAGIDESAGSLDGLLELAREHDAQGIGGEAPYPPHYRKTEGEAPRVQPSRRKKKPGERASKMPLITIAKARKKEDALAGLERWKVKHPAAAALLAPEDVLVDAMRGRSSTWTRIRVNLQHVPEPERPEETAPDPDYDPWNPEKA